MMEIKRNTPCILEFPCDVERLENGNTLITDAGDECGFGSEVIEVSPTGSIVWNYSKGLKFAHSAKRLKNSNTLISDTTNNRIIEVNPQKEIVFSSDNWNNNTGVLSDSSRLCYPNDAHKIDDNHYIITDRNNNRCIIVDTNGNIKWFYDKVKHPHNCDLLENGNVIIANSDDNSIIEVNKDKQIVWEFNEADSKPLSWPRDADITKGGNVLIADSKNSRIIEVDKEKNVKWIFEAPYFANFYDVDILNNNNILVSDQQHHQVLEIDKNKNIVWVYRNYRTLHNINPRLKNGSFKEITNQNTPAYWELFTRFAEGGGNLVWDKDAKPRPYPGIEMDRDGALCLYQVISIKPNTIYKMAGNIKTKDMSEKSIAYFQIAFLDNMGGLIQDAADAPKGNMFQGENDWTQDSFEAKAPENAVAAEIRLFISGKGKAFMKGLMLFC